jgi:hypothetical protein
MMRLFPALFVALGALALNPYAAKAQKPKKDALPKSNQVYVKVILPTDPATRDMDRVGVESWIAEQIEKRGKSKFTAATAWVPLFEKNEEATRLWNGTLNDKQWACPVAGYIVERADGRIKVRLDGWVPVPYGLTVSLTDEPGSREIAAVGRIKTEQGMPYVVILIGPPPEKAAGPADQKK